MPLLFVNVFSSATYQKLGKDKEAYEDALKALALIKEKPSVDVSVEAKAQLRKGYAIYNFAPRLPHFYHTILTIRSAMLCSPQENNNN